MSKIQTKWLANDAVDGTKLKLANDQALRARNAADNGDVDLFKLDASDLLLFLSQPTFGADPVNANDLTRKSWVDTQLALKEDAANKGIAGGYASLDGSGRLPASQLPTTAMEFKGVYDAATPSPALQDGTGTNGDYYLVSVAGTQDFDPGAGTRNLTFGVGDAVVYDGTNWQKVGRSDAVTSVNGFTGAVVLSTTDIAEGTNLYYTDARADARIAASSVTAHTDVTDAGSGAIITVAERALVASATQPGDNISTLTNDSAFVNAAGARTAAVVNSTAGNETDVAASVSAMKAYVAANSSDLLAGSEVITLVAGDITNGYIDLAQEAISGSVHVSPAGAPVQIEGTDYTLSVPAAVTRVTFAGDLAAELVAGDVLQIKYFYAA